MKEKKNRSSLNSHLLTGMESARLQQLYSIILWRETKRGGDLSRWISVKTSLALPSWMRWRQLPSFLITSSPHARHISLKALYISLAPWLWESTTGPKVRLLHHHTNSDPVRKDRSFRHNVIQLKYIYVYLQPPMMMTMMEGFDVETTSWHPRRGESRSFRTV